jgi:hypothetical protein
VTSAWGVYRIVAVHLRLCMSRLLRVLLSGHGGVRTLCHRSRLSLSLGRLRPLLAQCLGLLLLLGPGRRRPIE